jgi:hypothetical protein
MTARVRGNVRGAVGSGEASRADLGRVLGAAYETLQNVDDRPGAAFAPDTRSRPDRPNSTAARPSAAHPTATSPTATRPTATRPNSARPTDAGSGAQDTRPRWNGSIPATATSDTLAA